jgi:hypothetical protein
MLKKILSLDGAEKLSGQQQKNIAGGGGGNCNCFCYNSQNQKVAHSCFTYCPDGTIPGLYPGSTGNCTFPGGQ